MTQAAQPLKPVSLPLSNAVERPPRSRVLRNYFLAVAGYALFFSLWQVEPVPLHVHLAAILVAATCFIPMARWYAGGAQGLPMFELMCLSYALQFSTPVYHQPNYLVLLGQGVYFAWDSVFETLLYVEAGILALIVGYTAFQRSPLAQVLPHIDLPLSATRRPVYLTLAIVLGLSTILVQSSGALSGDSSIGALVALAGNQLYVAIVLLAYEALGRPESSRRYRVLLFAMITLAVIWGLTTGLLENAFVPIALFIIVRWHVRRKIPWVMLAVSFLAFIVLNSAKSDYRDVAWYGDTSLDLGQRLSLWADLSRQVVQTNTSDDLLAGISDLTRNSMSRFDLLHKFVQVRSMTPRYVPFYQGSTYEYMLIGWIPRAIWPDKPSASDGNQQMDVDYLFKYSSQVGHSTIGIGQLPEAYANFGLLGIIGIMLLQGLIFAALNGMFNGPASDGGRAIYLSLMVFMLNGIGSSTAIWFGALMQNALANALIVRVFATSWQVKPDNGMLLPGPTDVAASTRPTPWSKADR